MGEDDKKKQEAQPTDWQKAKEARLQEAAKLREYANSPVKVDTSGQRDYVHEFINSRIASQQETPEQQAAREKRERTTRKLAALTDGLVALSNIAGAMGGATPAKQASLSAAHSKAVKEAAERRRLNLQQYEVARKHAMALQQKQDADNAKRHDTEVTARRKAKQQADKMEFDVAKADLAQKNKEVAQDLAERKEERAAKGQTVRENQAERRLALSEQREGRLAASGGSGSGGKVDPQAYQYWMSLTEAQKKKYRDDNKRYRPSKQKDMAGNETYTNVYIKDDKAFIEHVWQERQAWLEDYRKKKSKVKQTSKKTKVKCKGVID